MDVSSQLDLSKINRMSRIEKTMAGWAVEDSQISGDDLKSLTERLKRSGYQEAAEVPHTFILAQGAHGAVAVADGSEVYLYWE